MTTVGKDTTAVGLSVEGLSKRYGRRRALSGLSCEVPAGACCAVIGENGAGKTTLFSIVAGFLANWRGSVSLRVQRVRAADSDDDSMSAPMPLAQFRRAGGLIGVLPQDVLGDSDVSLMEQLVLFGRLAGYTKDVAIQEAARLLAATDLLDRQHHYLDQLSHGMRVRFGIAQALVGQPELVLLDEPMSGLDPLHRNQIRELIRSLRGRTTMLISSHDLADLQGLCDHVLMISGGKCVEQGPLRSVLGQAREVRFVFAAPLAAAAVKAAFPGVQVDQRSDAELVISAPESSSSDIRQIVKPLQDWFAAQGITVLEYSAVNSLERVYLQKLSSDPTQR